MATTEFRYEPLIEIRCREYRKEEQGSSRPHWRYDSYCRNCKLLFDVAWAENGRRFIAWQEIMQGVHAHRCENLAARTALLKVKVQRNFFAELSHTYQLVAAVAHHGEVPAVHLVMKSVLCDDFVDMLDKLIYQLEIGVNS